MKSMELSRRSFLKTAAALTANAALSNVGAATSKGPLLAYVGTFSSPLHDVLPTQVDLPPGNGRGIHIFQVDRSSGALSPAGAFDLGTSPNCLALNAAGTHLYSTNETDKAGEGKEGTLSAFTVDRTNGQLTLLNTVRSGGAGPTYLSIHPSGKFVLVANYFGGSVAVLPILPDGRLGSATDVKQDSGRVGPRIASNAPPGTFAFRLMSFHLASNPGACSLSMRLNRWSTKRATRWYLSVLARQLYATRMVGTAMVSTRSPLAMRLG